MSTPLVISLTDELVEELEALAKKSDAAGEDWVSYADLAGTLENKCDIDYIVDASPATILALLAERAELLRDAERLDWFIKECCVMECANGSASPVVYRIYWSHEAEGQREWRASPRAAIDAAMQSEAKP